MIPWKHQTYAVSEIISCINQGIRRMCSVTPTGGGKSLIMEMLARDFLERGKKVIAYTNRRMLVDQLSGNLMKGGLYHGIRAAGYEDERDHPFQVSSIQTEHSRVNKKKTWELHEADLVMVDEAHIQTGNSAKNIMDSHHEEGGAAVIGFTATPLGLSGIYDHLIIAGTMSELRECGALVPAIHYAPDEPDLKAFQRLREGLDPTESQQRKAMMTPSIFGRVWEWYCKLNPQGRPCILFGPGVNESLWFAEQFKGRDIKAAHIDGNDIWIDGTWYKSDIGARSELKDRTKAGEIKVVCNRYVLREGVDWPWIEHVILAFIPGSLQTYLQTVGRGLRASPGKKELIVQDHGGAWWRHGSINANREWDLEFTDEIVYGLRAERLRKKKMSEPFRCPRCGRTWMKGTTCLTAWGGCGFDLGVRKRSRPVVGTDGQLREMTGDIFRPRRISTAPNGPELWKKMYFRSCTDKGDRSFRAAAALFAQENQWGWPDPQWPFMPTNEMDWFRHVREIPREHLT